MSQITMTTRGSWESGTARITLGWRKKFVIFMTYLCHIMLSYADNKFFSKMKLHI